MPILANKTYTKHEATSWSIPNYWDLIALCLILGLIVLIAWGAKQMAVPYDIGQTIKISLDPSHLPSYALRTILRMFIALIISLLFTFGVGALAAKSKRAERIIIPMIDVMQSVPILSFLSLTIAGFIALFPGNLLGPECAAIFAIFTSQVWNMTLSFYQSVKTVPKDLLDVAVIFKLSSWQKFWRVEVPFSMPGLLWNMMMSMSGSWFFVVASEAISVANQNITLPGVGSYIALAITNANTQAIIYAITIMLIVILLYDQLLFRPLVQWSEKFKSEQVLDVKGSRSWFVTLFQRTRVLRRVAPFITNIFNSFVNLAIFNPKIVYKIKKPNLFLQRLRNIIINTLIFGAILFGIIIIFKFLDKTITLDDIEKTSLLGLFTGIRVIILIAFCSLIWVPVGVWIGFRPQVAEFIQPVIQFLAAFPANLLFPVAMLFIIKYHLNINIWCAPLMVLGTQWYILFNVIAGASAMPEEVRLAAQSFQVKGWLKWKRVIIPGIFPFFVTGALTAAGGAWNASILAEVISWGTTKLTAKGLGAYIANYSTLGDFPKIALGTIMMCIFVIVINRLIWKPLYNLATERFSNE